MYFADFTHIHTVRIEELHSVARKVLRVFSPQQKNNLSFFMLTLCFLLRQAQRWWATTVKFVRRRSGIPSSPAPVASHTSKLRSRAQSVFVKSRIQALRGIGDLLSPTVLIPTVCAEWRSLDENDKSRYQHIASEQRRQQQVEVRDRRRPAGDRDAVVPHAMPGQVAGAAGGFLASPGGRGNSESWLVPADIEDEWASSGAIPAECVSDFIIDARNRQKLPVFRRVMPCEELGCCRSFCSGYFEELIFAEGRLIARIKQASKQLVRSCKFFVLLQARVGEVVVREYFRMLCTVNFKTFAAVWMEMDLLESALPGRCMARFGYHGASCDRDRSIYRFKRTLELCEFIHNEIVDTQCDIFTCQVVDERHHYAIDLDIELFNIQRQGEWDTWQLWPPFDSGSGKGGKKHKKTAAQKLFDAISHVPPDGDAATAAKPVPKPSAKSHTAATPKQALAPIPSALEVEESESEHSMEGEVTEDVETCGGVQKDTESPDHPVVTLDPAADIGPIGDPVAANNGAASSSNGDASSSGLDRSDVLTVVTEEREGKHMFYTCFLHRNGIRDAKPIGEMQPLEFSGKGFGLRYGMRCKLNGHPRCSRGATWKESSGTSAEEIEKTLTNWLLAGVDNPKVNGTTAHMGLPRD